MISKITSYFPLTVLLTFLIFTELLLFLGPLDYHIQNTGVLLLYLIILNVSLYLGYTFGIKTYSSINKTITFNDLSLVKAIIMLAIFLSPANLFVNWGLNSINPSLILDRFVEGLQSPAEVYVRYLEMINSGGMGSGFKLILIFLSPISFAAIPLGIYCWKELKTKYHFFVIFIILLEVIFWIGIGTRKGLLDLILIIGFVLIAKNKYLLEISYYRKKLYFWGLAVLILFVFYFIYSNFSRVSVDISEIRDVQTSIFQRDVKPFYENNISPIIYIPLISIGDYLCQGYYALSCALHLSLTESVFTYGFGNNSFVMVLFDRIFGLDYDYQMSQTYQGLLYRYYDIDPSINWHSIYVWLANDFTFFGVPIVVFVIGSFLSKTWLDVINNTNIFAVPLFSLFAIMVFYFFANNQVLSSSFIPFFVFFVLYKVRRYI